MNIIALFVLSPTILFALGCATADRTVAQAQETPRSEEVSSPIDHPHLRSAFDAPPNEYVAGAKAADDARKGTKLNLRNVNPGQPILILGDSLTCGPFGYYLMQSLHEANPASHIRIVCSAGSVPHWWWYTGIPNRDHPNSLDCFDLNDEEKVTKATLALRPQTVPKCKNPPREMDPEYFKNIELGSNLDEDGTRVIIAMGIDTLPLMPDEYVLNEKKINDGSYSKIVERVLSHRGASCEWVGPPHSKSPEKEARLDAFYDRLRNLFEREKRDCKIIDSRTATTELSPAYLLDGSSHRTRLGGQTWVRGIIESVDSPTEISHGTPGLQ